MSKAPPPPFPPPTEVPTLGYPSPPPAKPKQTYWIALHTYGGRLFVLDGGELDKGTMHYEGGYKRMPLVLGQPNIAVWPSGKDYWHTITGFTVWLDETASDCQVTPYSQLDVPINLWVPDRPPRILNPSTWRRLPGEPPRGYGHRREFTLKIRNFVVPRPL